MEVNFVERGRKTFLQINDTRIVFRNFEGRGDKFNRAGDRNFAVVIDDLDIYDELKADGWNVKKKDPRDEGDIPFMYLPVKVQFNDRGPAIWLLSGENRVMLDEASVACIDDIEIASVDLDIRPYDWDVNGRTGRTAYLQGMAVTQEFDRFAAKYQD